MGLLGAIERKDDAAVNAMAQKCIARGEILKIERVNRRVYATRGEAKADVFDYVERFYNPRRRHSTLGYLSPVEYENAMGSAQDGVNESRASPDSIGVPGRTRPLCEYPSWPKYRGNGDVNAASSFTCVQP